MAMATACSGVLEPMRAVEMSGIRTETCEDDATSSTSTRTYLVADVPRVAEVTRVADCELCQMFAQPCVNCVINDVRQGSEVDKHILATSLLTMDILVKSQNGAMQYTDLMNSYRSDQTKKLVGRLTADLSIFRSIVKNEVDRIHLIDSKNAMLSATALSEVSLMHVFSEFLQRIDENISGIRSLNATDFVPAK